MQQGRGKRPVVNQKRSRIVAAAACLTAVLQVIELIVAIRLVKISNEIHNPDSIT
jgi:hypothetical protein